MRRILLATTALITLPHIMPLPFMPFRAGGKP
jgi:hypothetical protein